MKTQILIIVLSQVMFGCKQNIQKHDVPSTKHEIDTSGIWQLEKTNNTRKPLLLSKDNGQTWENASNNLPLDLQVSFIEQKESELVLASDNMGVFISSENKTHWKNIGTTLPVQKINALHVSGNSIYVGAYRNGIFKTDNDGGFWQDLSFDLPSKNVRAILQHENQLFLGTDDGVYIRSLDSEFWHPTEIKVQTLSIYHCDGKLIIGTSKGTAISDDLGLSWTWIREEGAVHFTHNIGKRIVELGLNGDLAYSDDWGQIWTETVYEPREGSYIYEVAQIDNYLIFSNNYGIHRSSNFGLSWHNVLKTESMAFFDFTVVGNVIYGGTRFWDEYRERKN